MFQSLKMSRRLSNPVSCIVMCGLVQLIGCAPAGPPPTASVSGKVTRMGQPVSVGQIWFNAPEKGYSANAPLDAAGKYEITENLPPANYKVYITPPRITTPPKPGVTPEASAGFKLPDKYQTEQMSGLTADVKEGTQTIDFTLPD